VPAAVNPHLQRLDEALAQLRAAPLLAKGPPAEAVAAATLGVLRDFERRLSRLESRQPAPGAMNDEGT